MKTGPREETNLAKTFAVASPPIRRTSVDKSRLDLILDRSDVYMGVCLASS